MITDAVHHVSFAVRDLALAKQFYGEFLGLPEIERPNMGSLGGVWYGAGPSQVHLIETPPGARLGQPPDTINPLANHVAFRIDDYSKVLDVMQQRGIEVMQTNAQLGQMWIRDPDGNIIELIEPKR